MNLRNLQLRWAATVAVAAALAVPVTAQAKPDDLGGTVAPVSATSGGSSLGVTALNDRVHSPAAASAVASHPDNLASRISPGGVQALTAAALHPDNRAGLRGSDRTAFVVAVSGSSSFDWSDAGIGAGAALLLIVAASGSIMIRRQRRTNLAF